VSADQFSTVLDKEKYFCDNNTSNVDTEAEELTATGRQHAECVLCTHTYNISILTWSAILKSSVLWALLVALHDRGYYRYTVIMATYIVRLYCPVLLQCIDTVFCVAGRASSLWKFTAVWSGGGEGARTGMKINVKKRQFIHVNSDRCSHIQNSKNKK